MKSRFLADAVVAVVACLLVAAGAAGAGGASAQPGGHHGRAKEAKIERVKKRVRALRAYALTEELGLDTGGAGRLFPVLAKYDDEFDRLLAARGLLTKGLDGAGDFKDPKSIDKLIDQMLANQRAFWDLEEKRIAELRKILTPAQIARVLVVLPVLERKIQNQLRTAAQGKGAGPDPSARRADADDDDVLPNERPAATKQAPKQVPADATPKPKPLCDPFGSARTGCY
ncbi:hypothetical protein BH11MYX1_BH11MYX1_18280 [soil metagenome]